MYKVLLVDDEEFVLQGLQRFVEWEKHHFEVIAGVTSVARALIVLEEQSIDLIITDIQIPVQNGLDLLEVLTVEYPQVKTMILSSHSDFSYAQTAMRLGALDYLTKPVHFPAIHERLAKIGQQLEEEQAAIQRKNSQILTPLMIMNYINGYDSNYPLLNGQTAYLLHLSSEFSLEIEQLKKEVATLIVQQAIFVPYTQKECFLLLISAEITLNWQEFIQHASLFCQQNQLFVGISKKLSDGKSLKKASIQARKAANYQKIRHNYQPLFYQQIEELFVEANTNQEQWIQQFIESFVTNSSLDSIVQQLQHFMADISQSHSFTLDLCHQFGTNLLLELQMLRHRLFPAMEQTHHKFSQFLFQIYQETDFFRIESLLLKFIEELFNELRQAQSQKMEGELITQIKNYLAIHFMENISLQILSEHFFVTTVYLSRLFKQKTGQNFIDYLTQLRLEHAKKLLRQSNLKIYQIAEQVGYDNSRYFTRLFKETVGVTPTEFRKSQSMSHDKEIEILL
ncbi:response regulator [Enterococcus sp. LJL98]